MMAVYAVQADIYEMLFDFLPVAIHLLSHSLVTGQNLVGVQW